MISRKVDVVERAKRGKHDFFGKSSCVINKLTEDLILHCDTNNRARTAQEGEAFSSPTKAPDAADPPNKRARTEAVEAVDIADRVRLPLVLCILSASR